MQIHYVEQNGATDYEDSFIECPFNAKYVHIRFKGGTGSGRFSFDGVNDHGWISADATPETAYPNKFTFKTEDGVSKIWLKNGGVTFAVTFWR